MRKAAIFLLASLLLAIFTALAQVGQEQSEFLKITVKSREVSNGVVILAVQQGKKSFELQCNKGFRGCTGLEPADYFMVRLPKGHGIYDCVNADIYRNSTDPIDDKIGEYCLIEAK
ncbi:MAG TPA: hypothetical protein VEG30_00615 [Terriglobales bacterium]|nr:hypothetical protein [Terriglobales bacterium]